MRPLKPLATPADTLTLELQWGDTVLEHVEVASERTLWIGWDDGVDLHLDSPGAGPRFALLMPGALGEPVLTAPEPAEVRTALGETWLLRRGATHALAQGDRVEIPCGDLRLVARRREGAERTPIRPTLDADYLRIAAISLVLHVAFLVTVLITPPHAGIGIDGLRRRVGHVVMEIFEAPKPTPRAPRTPHFGARHAGAKREGAAGPIVERPRRPGPRSRDEQSRNRQVVLKTGLVAALQDQLTRGPGVLARGGLAGVSAMVSGLGDGGHPDGGGARGLGMFGRGPGGGGDGPIQIGALTRLGGGTDADTHINHKRVEVQPCTSGNSCRIQSKGGLKREEIAAVMRRNQPRFKHCYEQEVNANPNLSGKIAVHFTIAPNGAVAAADVAESSMGNSEVEACVLRTTKSLRFPSPRGGGIVVVTYPFIFSLVE